MTIDPKDVPDWAKVAAYDRARFIGARAGAKYKIAVVNENVDLLHIAAMIAKYQPELKPFDPVEAEAVELAALFYESEEYHHVVKEIRNGDKYHMGLRAIHFALQHKANQL